MITVYGHPISTCTRKVLMTLLEKNSPYEFVTIDFAKKDQKSPEYLKRQPFGVVPAIDDDGFQMYESRAIIRYLDAKLSGTSLTPKNLQSHGMMEQWISVEASYFSEPAVQIIKQHYFAPMHGAEPDKKIIEANIPKVAHAISVIAKPLEHHEYLADDKFSLADITWMPYVEYLHFCKLDHLFAEHPSVVAWWKRVSSRPTWQKIRAQNPK